MRRLVIVVAMVLSLSGCGPSGSKVTEAGSKVTLRVGDQFNFLRSAVEGAGQDARPGYRLEWAQFVGGPAMIAAETGGSIDIGWMAETPTIFAQAAGSPIKVVAMARRPSAGLMALVVGARSPIHSVRDLRGRKVLYLRGTVAQYFVLRVLEQEGISLRDIQPVSATPGSETALVADGVVDAAVVSDPPLARGVDAGTFRVIASSGEPVTPEMIYLVAPDRVLNNPAARPLLEDFIRCVARSYRWQIDDPEAATAAVARYYKLPPRLARGALQRAQLRLVPIDDRAIAAQQAEADAFARLGLVKTLDVRTIFDKRFNDVASGTLAASNTAAAAR
jgi:sulfonate transport system substrate-binding protein